MNARDILSSIPDDTQEHLIENRVEGQIVKLKDAALDQRRREGFIAVNAAEPDVLGAEHRQRFINAALLADWACYAEGAGRVEYPRLRDAINAFPQGFRVWFCRMPDGHSMPVGYTGWYPFAESVFNKAHDRPQDIKHRGELKPQNALSADGDYIWLFNYSIVTPLRKSEQSRKMLQAYAADIHACKPRGLAAAVVSEESKPVARKFGMIHVGDMTHDGVSEEMWAAHFPSTMPHSMRKPAPI